MRIDLTPSFLDKVQTSARKPLQVLAVYFDRGTLWLSDREIEISPGIFTIPIVEDWGTVTTVGEGLAGTADTLQMTIVLWNGGLQPFSDNFRYQDPLDVTVDLFQLDVDLSFSDKALIDTFVIQEPIEFSEASRLLNMDLVSINMRYSATIGNILTLQDWPKALVDDVNKGIDLIIGSPGPVKTLCAKTPLICTMTGSILKTPTIVNVHENLDDKGFSASGYIRIDDEIMHYSSRDYNTFNVDLRGQFSTVITEHSDSTEVLEYITDHTYIIGQGPLTSVSDVTIGGLPATIPYTLDLVSDPATITFEKQPTYINFAAGARDLDVQFTATSGNNTAFQPQFAYDENARSSGALISPSHPKLSIFNTALPEDLGNIVRAFVSVEHWSTKAYSADSVQVLIDGIGSLGTLSKPSSADITTVTGEVDIDHSHNHASGGIHAHTSLDPNFGIVDPGHLHGMDAGFVVDLQGTPYNSTVGFTSSSPSERSFTSTFNFDEGNHTRAVWSATAKIRVRHLDQSGADWITYIKIEARRTYPDGSWNTVKTLENTLTHGAGENFDQNFELVLPPWEYSSYSSGLSIQVTVKLNNGDFGAVYADISNPIYTLSTKKTASESNSSSTATNKTSSGAVYKQNVDTSGKAIKSADDVDPLATANRQLLNIATTSASKTLIEKFDITRLLETIDWSWFVNRNVEISYVGSSESADVILTHVKFEIEYRPREVVITNNVSCSPVGTINPRPDKVVEYLLTEKAGIPISLLDSIWTNPEVWNDLEVWSDLDTWVDSGEQVEYPGDAAFDEAAGKFEFLGYTIDGVLASGDTVASAIQKICWQTRSRLIWSGGKIKLAVKESVENWVTVRNLNKSNLQLKSMNMQREEFVYLCNDIDIFYDIDRLSDSLDETQYKKSLNVKDAESIAKHGQKRDNSKWLFDLVRNDAMAQDVANYYIWRYGESATFYKFKAYLQQFDIEKEDTLRITSDFTRLINLPVKVVDISRIFGSGKNKSINLLEFLCESVRHRYLIETIEDAIFVADSIAINVGTEQTENDTISLSEFVNIIQTLTATDTLSVSDVVSLTAVFNNIESETIIATDALAASMTLSLSDYVSLADSTIVESLLGFGAGGFGSSPFGSPKIQNEFSEDMIQVQEVIEVNLH